MAAGGCRGHAIDVVSAWQLGGEQVASQIGYADGVTLRSLLRRKVGNGVRELRAIR